MTSRTKTPRWTDYMPLDDVLRAPRNPKNHNAQVIANSMARFGVVETPALDERTGRLVAGHGRLDEWERSRNAGDDPPDGIMVADDGGWLVPVNRGWSSRSDADAEAYLIVSNRSTELGGWDDSALGDVLDDLRRQDLLEFTGYDEGDLEDLAKLHEAPDLDDFAGSLGDGDESAGWPTIKIKAPHHVTSAWETYVGDHGGDPVVAFAGLLGVDPEPPAWEPPVWEPDLTKQDDAQDPQ